MGIQNASTVKSNNPIIFFMATKIRKVESKTKKLVSIFAETEYLHGSRAVKIVQMNGKTKTFLVFIFPTFVADDRWFLNAAYLHGSKSRKVTKSREQIIYYIIRYKDTKRSRK